MKAKRKGERRTAFPLRGNAAVKRAVCICLCGILGVYSPSLRRRVRVSDIWKTKNYLGGNLFL